LLPKTPKPTKRFKSKSVNKLMELLYKRFD